MSNEKCWQCDEIHPDFGYEVSAAFHYNPGQPIRLADIARVDREWTDGEDEPEFAWLFELTDGRWAAASGGHDYTGWDCQSHLSVSVYATRDAAVRFGFDLNMREMLGELLPGESIAKEHP